MTTALRSCPITVDDVDAAIAFYTELGLTVTMDVPNGEFRWVTMSSPGGAGADLVLSAPDAGRSPEDGEALHRLLAKGSLPGPIIFGSDDLDATFERVRASGAEVLQEPADQPWGVRDCAFRDPAGNHIRINQI
ncbi:VOC family protein [Skermania piniformis]|uniref:VOC family protein n=1 Tax=Skermania pinensis TaxID=39122 RepID=A0ABX8S9B0_9ACTN|nr:VOC family protein [Skermania piniformis]QXQ14448.1 VOC family protein [Skermania piniformis]